MPLKRDELDRLGRECGLDLVGVIPAGPVAEADMFASWAERGLAGEMTYLTDHRASLRQDPRSIMPEARSILVAAVLYNAPGPAPNPDRAWISRYAWGSRDYHDILRERLEALAARLKAVVGDFAHRVCVDTAPLLERALAYRAGLGWIGRNTCLINQMQGSWFFLGELLMSAEPGQFAQNEATAPDRCGTCRRCIDACPTAALVARDGRYELDARLCISYHTIEAKAPAPEPLRAGFGHHVFGCDLCQDVCPWNRRAPQTLDPAFQPVNAAPELDELAALGEDEFRARFRHTALWRTKYRGLLRNVAIAMGNQPGERHRAALERLAVHEDPGVAGAAQWALEQLRDNQSR